MHTVDASTEWLVSQRLQPRLWDRSIFKREIRWAFNLGVEVTLSESQRCGSSFGGCWRARSAVFSHWVSRSVSWELRLALPGLLFEDDLGLKVKHTECFNRRSKFHALLCGVKPGLISHPSQRLQTAKASTLKVWTRLWQVKLTAGIWNPSGDKQTSDSSKSCVCVRASQLPLAMFTH